MGLEIIKFLFYSALIVVISKYVLVNILRKLAETLNLKAKTTGNIAGVATSVPELLTITFSAATGFIATSIYNVISSNIINFIQYIFAILLNKNGYILKNRGLRIDICLVIATILLPVLLLKTGMEIKLEIIPIFLLLFVLFYYINNNAHKLYLKKEEKKVFDKIEKETKWLKGKRKKTFGYVIGLLFTAITLYIIGNELSKVLEELCSNFHISESVLGIILGFVTSLPELITFFEAQKHYKQKEDNQTGVIEATNNLLSSNILNLFIIQSIGIFVYSFLQ